MKRRKKLLPRIVLSALGIVLFVAGSYLYSRWRSSAVAISIERIEAPEVGNEPDGVLKMASYNIAHGRGGAFGASNWDGGTRAERRRRLAEMGSLLADMRADIVVLNEVDFAALWSGHVDQAGVIAAAGGYPFVVRQRSIDVSIPFARVVLGNAILSRFPVVDARLLAFTPLSRFERLAAGNHDGVIARIRLPDDSVIAVCGVHLEVRSSRVRQQAAQEILDVASSIDDPFFVLGDLNSLLLPSKTGAAPRRTAISILVDSGRFQHFPGAEDLDRSATFPSEAPERVIDWILFPQDWRLVEGFVRKSPLSDHLPIAAFLTRRPRPGTSTGREG